MVALTGLMVGCKTYGYRGQYDDSIPLNEQSILKIPTDLTAVSFDDVPNPWPGTANFFGGGSSIIALLGFFAPNTAVVNVPPGEHTLIFNYKKTVQTGSSTSGDYTTTYYTTTSAGGLQVTYEFLAGHSYSVLIGINGDMISASIAEDSEGSADDTSKKFRGPKYTEAGSFVTPDRRYGAYLNWLGIGVMGEIGNFVDGKLPWGIYVDVGFGINAFNPLTIDMPIGIFGEFYPLKNGNMGFGLGGGYNIGIGPYIRAAYIPFHKKIKLRGYLELTFPVMRSSLIEEASPVGFGLGVECLF
jgi:hypothetical protein